METKQINEDKEFQESWNNHVDDFNRLRFSLKEEQWDELDSVLDHLRQLVENATVEKVFREAKRNESVEGVE